MYHVRLILFALMFAAWCPAIYGGHSSHHRTSTGSHSTYVRGYTRKDGTYVAPHTSHSHGTSTASKSSSTYRFRARSTDSYDSRHLSVQRDSRGRIKRSAAARDAFKRLQPCPSTNRNAGPCPGYVIDHVKPLECGGSDSPSNMQWQTVAEGKAKDKTERYCR